MQLSRPNQKYKKSEIYQVFDDPKSLVDINILTDLRDQLQSNKDEFINYITSISTWTKTYEIYLENLKIRTQQLMHINNEKMRAVRIKEFQSKNINIVDRFEVEENNVAEQQFIKELIAQLEQELDIQIQRSQVEEEAKMKREDLERRLKKAEQMIAQLPIEQLYQNELKYILNRSLQPKVANQVVDMIVNKVHLDQSEKKNAMYKEQLKKLDQETFELQKKVNQIRHNIFSIQQDNNVKAQQIEHMSGMYEQMSHHKDKVKKQLIDMEAHFRTQQESVIKEEQTRVVKEPQRPWRNVEKSCDAKDVMNKVTSELNNVLSAYQTQLIKLSNSTNSLNLEISKKYDKAEKDVDQFIIYVVKNDTILDQLLYIMKNVQEPARGVFLTQETDQIDTLKRSLHSVEIDCFQNYLKKAKQKKSTKLKDYIIPDQVHFTDSIQLSITDIK